MDRRLPECTHQTLFRTSWLNEALGHAIAPILALPFIWFRYFHLAHHRYTNDPDRDLELAAEGRPETWRSYLIYLSGWGYWSAVLIVLWTDAFRNIDAPYLPPRRQDSMRREARIILGLYVFAALSLLWTQVLV